MEEHKQHSFSFFIFSFEEHKYNIIRTSTLLVHTRAAVSSGGNLEPFVLNPINVEEEGRNGEGGEGKGRSASDTQVSVADGWIDSIVVKR